MLFEVLFHILALFVCVQGGLCEHARMYKGEAWEGVGEWVWAATVGRICIFLSGEVTKTIDSGTGALCVKIFWSTWNENKAFQNMSLPMRAPGEGSQCGVGHALADSGSLVGSTGDV